MAAESSRAPRPRGAARRLAANRQLTNGGVGLRRCCPAELSFRLLISICANILIRVQIDKIFEALASGPRRQILAYLSKAELTTSDLASRIQMTAPSMSRHLSVLENAGLVTSQRRGSKVFYRLKPDSLVNTLTGFALEICPVAGPLKRESRALAKRRRVSE
jgi:ArsR family transcriptional regulator, arsenate/arsenite/antimonite-responsive transcriptional repressor